MMDDSRVLCGDEIFQPIVCFVLNIALPVIPPWIFFLCYKSYIPVELTSSLKLLFYTYYIILYCIYVSSAVSFQ